MDPKHSVTIHSKHVFFKWTIKPPDNHLHKASSPNQIE